MCFKVYDFFFLWTKLAFRSEVGVTRERVCVVELKGNWEERRFSKRIIVPL